MIRVRLYYNLKGMGDVLMLVCLDEMYTKQILINDLCILQNAEKQIVGINFLNAAKYFSDLNYTGYFDNPKVLAECNELLVKNNQLALDFDIDNYFYVGEIKSCLAHPDSDHLHVCKVDVGDEILDIVCGASNCKEHLKVIVARVNAILLSGKLIVPSILRGVPSNGMLCNAKELELDYEPSGIVELSNKYIIGEKFIWKGND